jgi:thioredoxin reductase (NADPH)
MGFPTGISGMALMARAYNQAQKFGVELAIPDEALSLTYDAAAKQAQIRVHLQSSEVIQSRSAIIATGARYRRLDVANLGSFEATNIHYWASPLEAKLCEGQEIVLIGAGNSAGQAVVFLSRFASKIWLLVRGSGLEASMSKYLIERITALPNVHIVTTAKLTSLNGEAGNLREVEWTTADGAVVSKPIQHVFLFIGAEPNTDWLADSGMALDAHGFIMTGVARDTPCHPLESSIPAVFAIGDVRAGSVKRVAAAVGDGAQVIAALHKVLAPAPDS